MSPAITSKDLMDEFNVSAIAMGVLSSAYFYSYASLQIPVGVLSDTIGTRKTTTVFTLIASFGAILFGFSSTFLMAVLAWFLVGAGASGVWIPTLKILSQWFKEDEFATLSGILLAIGNVGAISASYPLAIMVTIFGWRYSYFLLAIITFFLASLCWIIVKDAPPISKNKLSTRVIEKNKTECTNPKKNLGVIIRNKYLWMLALWFLIIYGSVISFQGLWGGPYLMDTYNLSKSEAGGILMMIGLGMIIGSPAIGLLSDKILKTRKWVLVIWNVGFIIPWLIFLLYPTGLSMIILYITFFCIGFFGCSGVLVYAVVKELFPVEIVGTATSVVNIFPIIGVAIFQIVMGYLMDLIGRIDGIYPVDAYLLVFTFLLIMVLTALIVLLFIKETYKSTSN